MNLLNGSKLIRLFIPFLMIYHAVDVEGNDNRNPFLFVTQADIRELKEAVHNNISGVDSLAICIREHADSSMIKPLLRIIDYPSRAVSGDPHDYYSESPYWWPVPGNPSAPYIRKDGLQNSARFIDHKLAMYEMYASVFSLSLANFIWDEPAYAKKANQFLTEWFLNDTSRMNPHLEYGQAIPNRSTGRGVGIIETRHLIKLIEAVNILDYSGSLEADVLYGLQQWIAAYLKWMFSSKKGQDERNQGNNHSSWWGAQALAYAIFTGDADKKKSIYDIFRVDLIPHQMSLNGGFPEEEKRTLSLFYSIFNLEALSYICQMAYLQDVDLWRFKSTDGKGILEAMKYLSPFLLYPEKWDKKQMKDFNIKGPAYLVFAGMSLNNTEYIDLYKKYRQIYQNQEHDNWFDPFIIFLDMVAAIK